VQTYERAGLLLAEGELPDHLSVVLEYASTQPPEAARAFLRELSHIVRALFTATLDRGSPYASVLAAVLELAGERAERVPAAVLPPEPELDESWAEPEAFAGCTSAGQSRPGSPGSQPQPVHIHRKAAAGAPAAQGARRAA
jgi:nitrate reductase molybdenum cofactor assembly chaperone NarJ/NarW